MAQNNKELSDFDKGALRARALHSTTYEQREAAQEKLDALNPNDQKTR